MNLLKFYRIASWIRNLGISIIALAAGGVTKNPFSSFLALLHVSLIQMHSFSMNDYFDHKICGEKNYIGYLLKSRNFSEKKIVALTILPLIFLSFTLLISFSIYTFLLVLYVVIFFFYQSPLARLKRYWYHSIWINSFCLGTILFLYPYLLLTKEFDSKSLVFSIIFFFYMAFHEVIHQIAHYPEERILPRKIGIEGGIKLACLFHSIPIFVSTIAIIANPIENCIFIGTPFFSIFRIYKILRVKKDYETFKKIKASWHKFYSFPEGIYYLIFILCLNYFSF